MLKVLEKDLLDDKFIIKEFASNIKSSDKLLFNKKDIYYFGNYKEESLDIIRKKLLRNKKRLINAIEQGVKIIISGNSFDLLNNSFNSNDINLYTSYNPNNFRKRINKIKFKKRSKTNKLKTIYDISKPITSENFRYKNFICIKKQLKKKHKLLNL